MYRAPQTLTFHVRVSQSLKSYVFLFYIALTERSSSRRRWNWGKWASPKAYAWLSSSEIVFWMVTFGLSAKAAGKGCPSGVSGCAQGYVLVVLTLVME